MKTFTLTLLLALPTLTTAQTLSEIDLKALSLLPENQGIESNQEVLESHLHDTLGTLKRFAKSIQTKTINKDASKIEALKGTYIVSYTLTNTTYTDKIIIDQTYTATNGEVMGKGTYYVNQTGTPQSIVCGYTPEILSSFNADYLCTTYNIVYQSFAFRLAGNTLINGYYGIGLTAEDTASVLLSKTFPVTGNSIAPSLPTDPSAKDEYSPVTGKLTLPSVKVGAEIYNVVLGNEGNSQFRLESAVKAPSATMGIADEYVPFTGKLTLPNVKVGADYYAVIMKYASNQRFHLESAVKK